MEARTFPCQNRERRDSVALHLAGRLVCGAGFVDNGDPDAAQFARAADMADRVGFEQSAAYLRAGDLAVVACARNQATGQCLGYCGISK